MAIPLDSSEKQHKYSGHINDRINGSISGQTVALRSVGCTANIAGQQNLRTLQHSSKSSILQLRGQYRSASSASPNKPEPKTVKPKVQHKSVHASPTKGQPGVTKIKPNRAPVKEKVLTSINSPLPSSLPNNLGNGSLATQPRLKVQTKSVQRDGIKNSTPLKTVSSTQQQSTATLLPKSKLKNNLFGVHNSTAYGTASISGTKSFRKPSSAKHTQHLSKFTSPAKLKLKRKVSTVNNANLKTHLRALEAKVDN